MAQNELNITLCVPRQRPEQDPYKAVLVESDVPSTAKPNQVLIRVEKFGFSANNITYQVLGEAPDVRYFDFHESPTTTHVSPKTHGVIPVWGFGTVVDSSHPRISAGERVYGYFAPTRYLLLDISPADVNTYAFYVHRPHFPPDRRPYNQIIRCAGDPLYSPDPEIEDLTMLYRPLFWTAFWCADWLASSERTQRVTRYLVSSASAKTAFCLAWVLRARFLSAGGRGDGNADRLVVGLTSAKNVAFTEGLGLYDRVVEYADVESLGPTLASSGAAEWAYVDVAANPVINARVRGLFSQPGKARLVTHVSLGLTNVAPSSTPAGGSGTSALVPSPAGHAKVSPMTPQHPHTKGLPEPEPFFTPPWIATRRTQLSVPHITRMQADAWGALMRECRRWVSLERVFGAGRVLHAYAEAVKGLGPEKGLVWSLWEEGTVEAFERNVQEYAESKGRSRL